VNTELPHCRSCQQAGLRTFLSLGRTPLANALLTADELTGSESTYPLDLAFCPHCCLVQITETVPPEQLFRDYLYFSSFSDTMLRHARDLAGQLVARQKLGSNSLVVEAASNDGYLLQYYRQAGVPVLGIEPARNIAQVARERQGVPTLEEFFTLELAERLAANGQRAEVFHAHNVLAHVADLNGFVGGIQRLLRDDGIAIIEVPYLRDLIDCCEFDTIYHEHLCYFSLYALDRLFRRHSLLIEDVEQVAIHGGSLRLYAVHDGLGRCASERVTRMLREEAAWGVESLAMYEQFAQRVQELKAALCRLLADLKRQGKTLAAYGASAKGSTLLNFCGIGRETLDFVVDRSTAKQGRFTPGTRLPIRSPEELLRAVPDYVLLLTWNFAKEIFQQQATYRNRGGKFILPVPLPRVA
jgi:SAM-dependent methyltransferase